MIDQMRIASPCDVGWENMSGTERVRFCDQCSLHVYNISELTRAEVSTLIATSEGRICARLYRRADGTVITRDCPVGLRALRRRVARRAGATLAAVLGLAAGVFPQTRAQDKKQCKDIQIGKVDRKPSQNQQSALTGVVTDPNGAAIIGATLTLVNNLSGEKLKTHTRDTGEFSFVGLTPREYTLHIDADNFKKSTVTHLRLNAAEDVRLNAVLEVKGEMVTMGVVAYDSSLDFSGGTTTIRTDTIRRLPLP